jgi:hypothetical protein
MKKELKLSYTFDDLFDKWLSTTAVEFLDDLTLDEKTALTRKLANQDQTILHIFQLEQMENSEFTDDTRLIYKELKTNPYSYVREWVRIDNENAKNLAFVKEMFCEWVKINYTMRFIMGELNQSQDYLNLLKGLNYQALKFVLFLFEEYSLNNKAIMLQNFKRDFKNEKGTYSNSSSGIC